MPVLPCAPGRNVQAVISPCPSPGGREMAAGGRTSPQLLLPKLPGGSSVISFPDSCRVPGSRGKPGGPHSQQSGDRKGWQEGV